MFAGFASKFPMGAWCGGESFPLDKADFAACIMLGTVAILARIRTAAAMASKTKKRP